MALVDEKRPERNWLVKSSTRILGPFSVDEVGNMLLKKHISIIDEVRQPSGRWKYIREHQIFDEAVQALRQEQENSPEHTQTQTMTSTATLTLATAITQTDLTHPTEETVTPTPTPLPTAAVSAKHVAPAMKDVEISRESKLPLSSARTTGAYGLATDQRLQTRFVKTQRTIRRIAGSVIALMIIMGLWLFLSKTFRRDQSFEALIAQARAYNSQYLFDKALSAYRRASQIRQPDQETQAQLALALIAIDRQYVAGRRILENELADSENNRARKVDALLGISISYILEGSLREAEENLQKIIGMEPANLQARLDLGMIAIRRSQWHEAARIFDEILVRDPLYPIKPLALLARGVVFLEQKPRVHEGLGQNIISDITNVTRENYFLRHELLLVRALLVNPGENGFEQYQNEFLWEMTRQSAMFARDLRMDWRIAEWGSLERYCQNYGMTLPNDMRAQLLTSVCLAESGRSSESQKILNSMMTAHPNDPLVLYSRANLMFKEGLRNEATAVLRMKELQDIPQRQLLVGRICIEQGDMDCASKAFSAVLNTDRSSIFARSGLAYVYFQQKKNAEAQSFIREGLGNEPYFLPLIELRDQKDNQR